MLNACTSFKCVCLPLCSKSMAGFAHGRRHNKQVANKGQGNASGLMGPLKLLYLHWTTGTFSKKALEKIEATTRKMVVFERSGMLSWGPRLAVNSRLWRRQSSPPSASIQSYSQAGHPVVFACTFLRDIGVHACQLQPSLLLGISCPQQRATTTSSHLDDTASSAVGPFVAASCVLCFQVSMVQSVRPSAGQLRRRIHRTVQMPALHPCRPAAAPRLIFPLVSG